jgi:hypothetical protein
MTTTFTSNKALAKMQLNDEIATWGGVENTNTGILDASFGGFTTIPLANSNVILSSAQYQNQFLLLTGAVGANISITFPPIGSFYTIINETSGSSAFFITAKTTVAGARVIGLPYGSMVDIMTDGTNTRFRNLPPAGSYWDYAGSSTPAWVTGCSIPPYLYCNGTTFSSATYPVLANITGGTTLPDFRGRESFNANGGTGRITIINGDVLFAAGGTQLASFGTDPQYLPSVEFAVSNDSHVHSISNDAYQSGSQTIATFAGAAFPDGNAASVSIDAAGVGVGTTLFVGTGGSGATFNLIPPTAIVGIRMVRAA